MNLREDKHWAYGAGSMMPSALGQRPLMLYAQVQSDKTVESIGEVRKEMRALIADKPPTADEIAKVKADQVRTLPGSYETIGAVAGQVANMVRFQRRTTTSRPSRPASSARPTRTCARRRVPRSSPRC
jgi:predicted Zn-dependent peptidase